MCLSTPKPPKPPKTVTPPPPPAAAPSELENAVDSNATQLKKKKKGAKGAFGSTGTQYSGSASGSGLTIGGNSNSTS